MNIVLLLIPLGLVMAIIAIAAFLWAVNSGQYDGDVDEHARIALEERSSSTQAD